MFNRTISTIFPPDRVTVLSAPVVVLVTGGFSRSVPVDQPLLLDASRSKDLSINPALSQKSNLTFTWQCKLDTIIRFGANCAYIFDKDALSLSTGTALVSNMTFGNRYVVTVNAIAKDGRFSSADISVVPGFPGAAMIHVTSIVTKFNRVFPLQVFARIDAGTSQAATWTLQNAGKGFAQ